jgi:hypothetical protein
VSTKAATEGQLGELHNKVATVLTNALKVVEKAQDRYLMEEDVPLEMPLPEVSAPLLSVAAKFLADNKITCVPEESSALTDLEAQLEAKRKRREGKRLAVGNVIPMTGT